MENNIDQNLTSLEAQPPVPSVDSLDEFDKAIRFLSELPTERAMKDVSKGKYITESIKKVIETMAFSKMDIVRALRLMHAREKSLEKALSATLTADKAMADFIEANPNYEIDIKAK